MTIGKTPCEHGYKDFMYCNTCKDEFFALADCDDDHDCDNHEDDFNLTDCQDWNY